MLKRRTRKSKNKKSDGPNFYFDSGTQEGIVKFQGAPTPLERAVIYEKQIMPAFNTLVENLILIYGFARDDSFTVLKNDCVSFLYETLHKFDGSRGTKAFSYFNVVAKNWLILNSRRKKKNRDNHVSINDTERLSKRDEYLIASSQIAPSPDDVMIDSERRDEIMQILHSIKGRVESVNDVSCINAVITVHENLDNLDFLNKRAIYVYVRDISGLNSKQLSSSMSVIRRLYREVLIELNKSGSAEKP